MNKEQLYEYMEMSILSLEHIYKRAIDLDLENDQNFLDWLDKINEISVRK